MPQYTFDTCYITSNKLSELPDNFLLSEIVILELIASASDKSKFNAFRDLRAAYEKDGLLMTPNSDDWLMASKILFWLEQGTRKGNRGKSPRKQLGATQRMAFDVLIAVTARRYKATVVTENFGDFEAIRYYCKFGLIKGADFHD